MDDRCHPLYTVTYSNTDLWLYKYYASPKIHHLPGNTDYICVYAASSDLISRQYITKPLPSNKNTTLVILDGEEEEVTLTVVGIKPIYDETDDEDISPFLHDKLTHVVYIDVTSLICSQIIYPEILIYGEICRSISEQTVESNCVYRLVYRGFDSKVIYCKTSDKIDMIIKTINCLYPITYYFGKNLTFTYALCILNCKYLKYSTIESAIIRSKLKLKDVIDQTYRIL